MIRDKPSIKAWLHDQRIKDYTLVEDNLYGLRVNTSGLVDLSRRELQYIPVKFGYVSGGFFCDNNHLSDLRGCPDIVVGHFNCESNSLTSLEGGPQIVTQGFSCSDNILTSLLGAPTSIGENFDAFNNQLLTLEHLPEIEGYIHLQNNPALYKTFLVMQRLVSCWRAYVKKNY